MTTPADTAAPDIEDQDDQLDQDAADADLFDRLRERESEPVESTPDDPPDRERSKQAKRERKRKTKTATARSGITDAKIREQLAGTLGAIGSVMVPFDPWCGGVVLERSEELTDALIEVSKSNPAIRKTLEAFAVTSTWGTFLGAAAAVAVPIAAHHSNVVPGELAVQMGPDRDTLATLAGSDEAADAILEDVRHGRRHTVTKPEPIKPVAPDNAPPPPPFDLSEVQARDNAADRPGS